MSAPPSSDPWRALWISSAQLRATDVAPSIAALPFSVCAIRSIAPGSWLATASRSADSWLAASRRKISMTCTPTSGVSRRIGGASNEVFKRVARTMRPAVLENFFHHDDRDNVVALGGPFLEVHCACPPAIARERYATRERHPCHFDREYGLPAFDRWIEHDNRALGLGEVLEVDTTQPTDIASIAAWLRVRM